MGRVWRRVRIGVLATDALGVLAGYGVATFAHHQLLTHTHADSLLLHPRR